MAWVIMPEHFHLLLRPAAEQTAATILRRLKAPFARRVLARWRELDAPVIPRIRARSGQLHFWQVGGGYDRNLVSQAEVLEKINYIHANPVRRGLAATPTEYRWSSAAHYAGDSSYRGPVISAVK